MINKVILVGNVGADPEVRTIESGVKVARLRLATSERIFNRKTGEAKEHTEWHTVILWRGHADVADRFIRKGSQIYIEGALRSRDWMTKDNVKQSTVEIVANDLKLLGRYVGEVGEQKPSAQPQEGSYVGSTYNSPEPQVQSAKHVVAPKEDVDDLPF
ncbi:MAG: single-stranded DNA-binding protein [Rikenellaceae bacterium]